MPKTHLLKAFQRLHGAHHPARESTHPRPWVVPSAVQASWFQLSSCHTAGLQLAAGTAKSAGRMEVLLPRQLPPLVFSFAFYRC